MNLVITTTEGFHGNIFEKSIDKLTNLHIHESTTKDLMKFIHQNAIKYVTYSILRRKRDHNQAPVALPR